MLRALDRWAAWLLLGAGGVLAAVSALFSAGSSGGRLTWIGIAALALGALIGAGGLGWAPAAARARVRRARGDRALARAVAARVGIRAGGRVGAPAGMGAAREGDSGPRWFGPHRAAQLTDRLLERARV